ncbi:creatininase family protein [Novosphingobium rosa]|uniref:creatininase family protein n=1 Tax=Novosphingobium rosa TaxID=76978 RepID=UPI000834DBAF|nr:creatininase family protein [Novosphingobium rosa]
MKWQDLTTSELETIDRATPLFLSIGAVEQHGPHLPLATDSLIGAYFLEQLDRALGEKVLILPQVSVGCSHHHMDFSGTLSVSHAAFQAYVAAILHSALAHGFTNVVLFNSHAGNQAVANLIAEEVGAAHPGCRIVLAGWWLLVGPELRKLREGVVGLDSHAGDLETSIVLHAAPDAVRAIVPGDHLCTHTFDWASGDLLRAERATLYRTMHERTCGSGVAGDPTLATAEKGEAITGYVIGALADIVTDLTGQE